MCDAPYRGRRQDALPLEREAGPPIALTLHELQAMDLAFGHAVAGLQLRNGKAVVLLSQGIPEPAGHVLKPGQKIIDSCAE